MSLSRDSRSERKLKAVLRAQFRLKQRLEVIDWEEEQLIPAVEALKAGKSVLGLPEGAAFDIRIEEEVRLEDPHPVPSTDHSDDDIPF